MELKHKTPLLDDLESGPWPSFVSDLKREAESRNTNPKGIDFQCPAEMPEDLLGVVELSYEHGRTHWKHGGIVGVFGYGGGVIGRYCDQPEMFPAVAHFHTIRINQPSAKYYTTEYLEQLADLCERRGSGITNMHGSTGDIVFLGSHTPQLEEIFWELTHNINQDLGGSGGNLRTPSCCLGMSRCEYACFDTQAMCHYMTNEYQDELHRPAFPYKFKMKFDGCPNCCVASIARSDLSFIGTWRDDIRRPCGSRLGTVRHPERGRRSLPRRVYGLGWQQARYRHLQLYAVHALHKHHAESPQDRARHGSFPAGWRKGPHT
jgi:sulfite reductase alpha subunit